MMSKWGFADPEPPASTPRAEPGEKESCQAQLNLIFEAIQEYRRQHQDRLPERLSELTPDYIRDAKTLICPYVQRTGGLRQWSKKIQDLGFDPRTSYGYEFTQKEMDDSRWRGLPKRTFREWKERQMRKLGDLGPMVPIVRCHFHEPRLNLAFGGSIYGSGGDWEDNFSNHVPAEDLIPTRLLIDPAARKKIAAEDLPPRDPHLPPRCLDLSRQYNGLLADPWQGFPGDNLSELPAGLQEFGGIPFDVRGVIQLNALEFTFPFPQKVEDIRVSQKCSRIQFLHATVFKPGSQTNVATYVIHYADNEALEIPITYGRHISDWWFDKNKNVAPTDANVAWTGQSEAAKAYGKAIRIYQFTWRNPRRDTEVARISVVSRMSFSAPFIIAVTVDP